MTAEQLKASILQMAIEGKLVPQLDDEPAVDIEAVEPEEVPFAIPEKWKWVRLQDIAVEKPRNGYSPKSVEYPTPVKNLMLSATTKGFFRGEFYKYIDEHIPEDSYLWLKYGDVLVQRSNSRELVGMACIFDGKEKEYIYPDLMMKFSVKEDFFSEYIVCVLQSPYGREYLKNEAKGSAETMPKISQKTLLKMLIPVPSLSEQERIIARLNEILPLIEEYGKAHSALKNVEQTLPDQLRASLLQEAIQGKLVPQLDDEPAVDMAGEEPDEVPFAIPDKWKWVRLGDISQIVRGGSPRPIKSYLTDSDDGINWIKIGDSTRGSKYITSSEEKIIPSGVKRSRFVKSGTLILSNSMSFGYPYILKIDGCIHDGWLAISNFEAHLSVEYLYFLFRSPYCRSEFASSAAGAVVKNLNIGKVESLILPLPPLAEQRRIVARLEELLPHVDAIAGLR